MNDSVYRPFSWNFRDQGAEERVETAGLLGKVRRYPVPDPAATVGLVSEFIRPSALRAELVTLANKMVRAETWIFEPAEYDLSQLTAGQLVDLRALLRRKQYFHANEAIVLEKLKQGVVRIIWGIQDGVPKNAGSSPFSVPLVSIFPDAKANIQRTHNTLMEDEYDELELFADLKRQLYRNLCLASNLIPDEPHKRAYKFASESDLPPEEAAEAYLANTPFLDIFKASVPLPLTHGERFSHMHVVGGTGAGKTTLLQQLILHDLQSDDPPALVIVDGQTDLVRKLSRLQLFEDSLRDRLVLITPRDIAHPPAINIFDVNRSRLGSYSEETKEQVTAGVIQIFDYLFAGLLGADLTAKQGVFFRFVARLMLALPETMGRNATILDLLNLMADPAPYRDAIRSLPPIPREFFERDFPSKTFTQTKEQIRYRLNAILENPTLARLFTSTSTKVDFFTELNKGSVILVDTARDFLKGASGNFGRIFISLVLQAILERAAIPEHERKPAFLIVDEAASYFDSNIDDLLTEARKYKLGCVFAHQFLDQCTSSLRASFAANTAIKMVSGVSISDARSLAPDLRTTADSIMNQPKLHFASYIRNVTPEAVSIPVQAGLLERQRRMTVGSYDAFREANRMRVSLSPGPAPARSTVESSSAGNDTTPSPDW